MLLRKSRFRARIAMITGSRRLRTRYGLADEAVRECHRIAPIDVMLASRCWISANVPHNNASKWGTTRNADADWPPFGTVCKLTGKNQGSRASLNGDQPCQKTRFPTASQGARQGFSQMT